MKLWIWPLLLAITIFFASGSSSIAGPKIVNSDKLVHFLMFGLGAAIVLRCRKPVTGKWAITTLLLISSFGVFDEFRQSFTPGRSVEWQDWLADTLGAFVSITLYMTVPLYRSILEKKFLSKSRQENASKNNESI